MRLESRQQLREMMEGAHRFEDYQTQLGKAPLETAAAAAMLIGLIVGEGADDLEHLESALGHLFKVQRMIANDIFAQK